jgi:non-canonical purine NTP pyrophosphatase (RdgB/HAM1 family)
LAHKQQLVVATNNKGKLKEFSLLLPAFEIIAQSSLNIVPEEELGKTFFENSIQKARVANNASGIAALGDDSGLIVPALNNLPGLHSARYAHKNANDEENREHLKNELEKINEYNQEILKDLEYQITNSDDANISQINNEIDVINRVIIENKLELEEIIIKLSQIESNP